MIIPDENSTEAKNLTLPRSSHGASNLPTVSLTEETQPSPSRPPQISIPGPSSKDSKGEEKGNEYEGGRARLSPRVYREIVEDMKATVTVWK
eukprot:82124-Amorphochlora_amoeboformis.AAC.1